MKNYTVKQMARLAGVTVRTLHYYDQIGLLPPTAYGDNGYRYYGEEATLRLQQILFFRELDFSLEEIRAVLDEPGFDMVQALQAHRTALEAKAERLANLIITIDKTISHIKGEYRMKAQEAFEGFSDEKQKEYEQEAMKRYGEETVKASMRRWNGYTEEQKAQIMSDGGAIYAALVEQMAQGPTSPEAQAILVRWHQHLRYFYEPSLEILRGLGNAYNEDPEFNAFFTAIHTDLPPFLQVAITYYVDMLETEWLERELDLS
jgi:MerR family transcriptional regulator, thiopeptide resistance regulator